MIREGLSDWKRHKSDKEANNKPCLIYNKAQNLFEQRLWNDIQVGDLMLIKDKQIFPADMILLGSADSNSQCFV